jgi:hypothetical protein
LLTVGENELDSVTLFLYTVQLFPSVLVPRI